MDSALASSTPKFTRGLPAALPPQLAPRRPLFLEQPVRAPPDGAKSITRNAHRSRVGIGSRGVGSDALDAKDVEGRRACGACPDGLCACLEHDIVSQRRRVEVDKLALCPAGIDDIAVAVGSRLAKQLSDPIDIPGNPAPGLNIATLWSATTPLPRVSTSNWLVRLFRTTELVLDPPMETSARQPGVATRPSAATVLLAIRLLWRLTK